MRRVYTFLISLVLISCGNEKREQLEIGSMVEDNQIKVSKTQFETENMELGLLTEQEFNETIKATGFIDVPPQNKASVSTFMEGYVKQTPLLVGDKVNKGQLVVTLQNTGYVAMQQEYLEIAEQLNYLRSEYTRQQALFNEKITSEKNFLKAESIYKSTKALYNGLRQKLKMMNLNPASVEEGNISSTINLYAPISGYITKVNVSNGSFVSSSAEILEIVNTDHIHLELALFEKDILKVKKGQQINFRVPEASNDTFKAEVHLVGTSVDETNRTIKVHGHIDDNETNSFVMGMFIDADILTDTKIGKALPKEAITEIDGDYFAMVLEETTKEGITFGKVKLENGKQNEEFIEVLNIADFADKQVLIKGSFMLLSE